MAAARGKNLCDSPLSRTDLDHGSLAYVAERVGDGMTCSIVDKEVLSEFWLAFHRPRSYFLHLFV